MKIVAALHARRSRPSSRSLPDHGNRWLAGALLAVGLIIALVSGPARAQDSPREGDALALRKIMKDLGAHMQTVTDGISREDWKLVEQTARLIADHPRPPMAERARILSFMGSDAAKFRAYDGKTHDAAAALAEAAKSEDGTAVIRAFEQVQLSCFGCHQEFRRPFLEHFYGGNP
ncbi:MAG TPA: cytochrome c [Steroidobacter sp.]|nr:cytochrome c [Steroidobacteraceae bacterium]HLS80393.1 cytochrome c [Steroidobacter sp.]